MEGLVANLRKADRETLDEILREAESFLGAQLTAAVAADARAMAFSSLLASAAAAIGAASIAAIVAKVGSQSIQITGLGLTGGLLISMLLAMLSARPQDFEFAGNDPAQWVADIEAGTDLRDSLAEQAAWYSRMINTNRDSMERSARWMVAALWVAWGSLAASLIASIGAILTGV